MATNKNITMKRFNGTGYDTLYPKTIVEQVIGAYTKQQILSNATAAMFRLGDTAVPDDAFALLGKYNLHWWRRRTAIRVYRYDEVATPQIQTTVPELASSVPSATLVVNRDANTGSSAVDRNFYYSSSIEIDQSTGEVKLVNPESSYFKVGYGNGFSATEGTYFTNVYENPTAVYEGAITASNGTQKVGGFYYQYLKSGVKVITSEKVFDHYTDLGDWEYVTSISKETYPENGYLNGYIYEYLGIPFDNVVNRARIETGSYVGTGTYGSGNKNSLTFDKPPKMLIIASPANTSYGDTRSYNLLLYISGFNGLAPSRFTNKTDGFYMVTISGSGNTVSWYSDESSLYQLNVSGATYDYIVAI